MSALPSGSAASRGWRGHGGPAPIGAAWVHAGNGWLFTAPNGTWEYPTFLAVVALAQALQGAGAFALWRGPASTRLAA